MVEKMQKELNENGKNMKVVTFNTDEGRLFWSEKCNYSYDFVGRKRVTVDTLAGDDFRKAMTIVLACTSEGVLYPPVCLLGGKTTTKTDKKSLHDLEVGV